jgi:hypothetical protein
VTEFKRTLYQPVPGKLHYRYGNIQTSDFHTLPYSEIAGPIPGKD